MAVNLAQVLVGVAALKNKGELNAVKYAVKERLSELKKDTTPHRLLTDDEKDRLAQGNSAAMILVNEQKFNHTKVADKDMPMAKKWFNAPKPYTGNMAPPEQTKAYYQWRLWNAVKWHRYKGGVITEKATGISPPRLEEEDDEEEGSEEEAESEEEEMAAAMAAVRVE
jgi:hypothetical protein